MANKYKVIRLGKRYRNLTLARAVRRVTHVFVKGILPSRLYARVQEPYLRWRYAPPFSRIFPQIAIETRTDCDLRCEFCPQSTQPRPKQIMSEDLFKKIIDDLATIDYVGQIAPVVNNEPLLDDRIFRLISYARQRCPFSSLLLITNGRRLSVDTVKDLFAAGLDILAINDYRKDRAENPVRLSDNISQIAKELSDYDYKISIICRSSVGTLTNRAGNITGRNVKLPLRQFCVRPFFEMVIQPEGKAVLCCQDYRYEETVGDARISSVADIWFNEKYRRIRAELYERDRTGKLCEKCDYEGF